MLFRPLHLCSMCNNKFRQLFRCHSSHCGKPVLSGPISQMCVILQLVPVFIKSGEHKHIIHAISVRSEYIRRNYIAILNSDRDEIFNRIIHRVKTNVLVPLA